MSRKDEVAAWLRDPITQQFIAHVQVVIRENRIAAIEAAALGDRNAQVSAVTVKVLREVLTEGFAALADEKLTKEAIKDAAEQEDPEQWAVERFAELP